MCLDITISLSLQSTFPVKAVTCLFQQGGPAMRPLRIRCFLATTRSLSHMDVHSLTAIASRCLSPDHRERSLQIGYFLTKAVGCSYYPAASMARNESQILALQRERHEKDPLAVQVCLDRTEAGTPLLLSISTCLSSQLHAMVCPCKSK